ncbi:putative diacyglycerol O-acyltransferase MT1468 [Montipora foliosa]|uniref:putative diacyglycerol O-acyltransferase MT1468 n=1 Tax=Montipora foliosa TaxID=591990 RepID=UPI0035F163A6
MQDSTAVELKHCERNSNAVSSNMEPRERRHTKIFVEGDDHAQTTQVLHTTVRVRTRLGRISSLLSCVWFFTQCLLCYALLLLLLTPLLPFTAVFYILKAAERGVVKMTSRGFHLTGMDSMLASLNEDNRPTINALLCLENEGSFEEGLNAFRQAILERLIDAKKANGELLYPRVRCYIRSGWFQYFFQEDQSFKAENHVFKWDGEVPNSKDELVAIASKLSGEPFPKGRSPWYCCCIPTNFGDNDFAVVFRVEHSIADGISLVKFLIYNLPDRISPQTEPLKFLNKGRSFLIAKAALSAPRYFLKQLFTFADHSKLHGPNLSGEKRVAWYEAIELQLIKDIKSATGLTVNDVLMSCVSLALRRYFQRIGVENPDDFTAAVPVDVRTQSSLKELAFENKFSFIFLKLAVSYDGVLKQLHETGVRTKKAKVSGEPLALAAIIYLSQELSPEFLTSKLNAFLGKKTSCILSNVPGPNDLLTVRGSRVKLITFWPPQRDNIGVGLSIFTYAGKVIFGVQGDVSVLPDPELIVEEFRNALSEMTRCVLLTDDSVSDRH